MNLWKLVAVAWVFVALSLLALAVSIALTAQ